MVVIGCRILLYVFLTAAAWQDGCRGRIPVRLAECVLIAGILLCAAEGWEEVLWYLWRFVVFAAPFFFLSLLGMMGGGDWKLFGLTGALAGWYRGLCIAGLGLLLAGIFGAGKLLCTGRLRSRLQLFDWYCRRCIGSRHFCRYPAVTDDRDKIRLGCFVWAGALLVGVWRLICEICL